MSNPSAEFQAGAAEVNITPPVGTWLTGFGGRTSGCTGIHDDLFAKALVCDNGGTRAAIVTCDLLGLDADTVKAIRAGASQRAGIPADNVMISCSHTHSGPAAMTLLGMGNRDDLYVKMLIRKIVGVLTIASDNLEPARIGCARESVQCGNNRREMKANGTMVLGVNPQGKVAPYVNILRVDDGDGRLKAVLSNHAAHPVALRGNNLLVSADFPGYTMRALKKIAGEDVVTMFAQGCCGDINCIYHGTFADAERVGNILTGAVLKGMELIDTVEDGFEICCAREVLPLPLQQPPTVHEAERMVKGLQKASHEADSSVKKRFVEWAEELLELAREGKKARTRDFEVQVMRLGNIAIAALAAEVFVGYQLWIDEHSPFDHTFVFGYANGVIGYVPTADEFPKGGYEVETANKYYPGTLMITPECEKIIHEGVQRLFQKVSSAQAQ